ncbi:MAG: sulfite exporter TauE/SafE family protein [Clostridiales bacterium]|nr:sulfite exporter TauE/SafE family protein [Clostridiales bacterium]
MKIATRKNVKYAVTGALAGAANGFFGSGGGLFVVPLLTRWLHMEQRRAFATSVAIILPLSAVSLIVFLFRGTMDFFYALPFLLGGLTGGLISGRVFGKVPVTFLRRLFGLLIIYGGIRAVLLL